MHVTTSACLPPTLHHPLLPDVDKIPFTPPRTLSLAGHFFPVYMVDRRGEKGIREYLSSIYNGLGKNAANNNKKEPSQTLSTMSRFYIVSPMNLLFFYLILYTHAAAADC